MSEETNSKLKNLLNHYGSKKEPFFFLIDYDIKKYDIIALKDMPEDISYSIDDRSYNSNNIILKKYPIPYKEYKKKFDKLQNEIREGNSYLLNLTAKTTIETNYSLKDIYNKANGRFKLYYKDKFVVFSPERFIKISDDTIYTFPMKGTIDASIQNAQEIILNDKKELAEHTMVVDLLRNDIGKVANSIKVEKFRYCEKIKAGEKELYQISSKISGKLDKNWQSNIGDILLNLLPAGSITGTPKKSTIKILKDIEGYKRGYFTGVFGVFDGDSLDSAVMIRYIEKDKNRLVYKSGGGITSDSVAQSEYDELLDKVYIP